MFVIAEFPRSKPVGAMYAYNKSSLFGYKLAKKSLRYLPGRLIRRPTRSERERKFAHSSLFCDGEVLASPGTADHMYCSASTV